MISERNIIYKELSRITGFSDVFLPITTEQIKKVLPLGPDGLIIVTGKDGAELIRGVRDSVITIREKGADIIAVFVECAFLRMDELAVLEAALSSMEEIYLIKGLSVIGMEGGDGRISIFFGKWKNHIRRQKPLLKSFWERIEKCSDPFEEYVEDPSNGCMFTAEEFLSNDDKMNKE